MRIGRLRREERGASLVEFALVAPLVFVLIFGMIELGWLFAKNTEVRHGAREAARLAIVDFGSASAIVNEACGRMGLATSAPVTIDLSRSGNDPGTSVFVTVTAQAPSLTGVVAWIIPSGLELESTVEMFLEQTPSWTSGSYTCP